MRAGPIVAGTILLILGVAAAIGGGMMKTAADYCLDIRCDGSGEAFAFGVVGRGIFLGGAIAGLAGIGLIVAGVVTDARPRVVPVETAPMRACPSCTAATPRGARYCTRCGTAIALILTRR